MSFRLNALAAAAVLGVALAAPPTQVPLGEHDRPPGIAKQRPLHGRFLQITDFHPDRFYEIYSSTDEDSACHRGRGPAGIYGAETSECDSPIALVNKTMEWVAKEFKDNIDFVVWTGDSARHDNDDEIPRTKEQVLGLNSFMVDKMTEVFGKHNGDGEDRDPNNDFVIPIIPNLGNNDILPHNILAKGPNQWTRTYSKLWRQFIPEVQKHSFEQGGWFYVEVIPHKLAVFSLNTLYFFDSNSAADGCAARSEPGFQQMEWLRIQLQFMRDRGMKAILIGHVPPVRQDAKTSWDETCWQKYTLWLRQYRDVVVSSHYGHFNYDHFMFQDFKDLDRDTKKGRMQYLTTSREDDDDMSAQVKTDYFIQLRDEWSELPTPPKPKSRGLLELVLDKKKNNKKDFKRKQKKYLKRIGGEYAERFAATFVSGSVVPNLYPTLRVFEYNITGMGSHTADWHDVPEPVAVDYSSSDMEIAKKKHKKHKFVIPEGPSRSAPPGPAYSPQSLSLIKYKQYFANLTYINNDFLGPSQEHEAKGTKWHEGKHKGKKPHDKDDTPKPKKFKFEELYDTKDDDIYKLDDLTMPNLIDLARRIGEFVPEEEAEDHVDAEEALDDVDVEKKKKHKHKHKKAKKRKGMHGHRKENEAWFTFVRRAYVGTMNPEDLDDEFGR